MTSYREALVHALEREGCARARELVERDFGEFLERDLREMLGCGDKCALQFYDLRLSPVIIQMLARAYECVERATASMHENVLEAARRAILKRE